MTSSRATLAALLALALVACNGGSTGPGTDTPGPEQPGFNDQGPPKNDDAPVDSYDPPPGGGEQPGSSPDAPPSGGGSDSLCSRLCTELSARQCDVGDQNTCASECAADLDAQLGDCVDEFAAFFDCMLASPGFACVDGAIDDTTVSEACAPAALAYANCANVEPEPGPDEPGPGECTPDDGCAGCTEECDACLCVLDDESLCQASCQ